MEKRDIIKVLKAARKLAREEEIRLYGHPICFVRAEKDKKLYNRKEKHKRNYKQIECCNKILF